MASKSTSNLHGQLDRDNQSLGSAPANSPVREGRQVNPATGPSDHDTLLDYYFGDPTSSFDNKGHIEHSKW